MKRVNIFKNLQLGENMVYSLVWTAIFLIPFMNAHLMSENEINFGNVIISWGKILPYFSIFLVNNYLLAPLLLLRNRYILYSITLFILVLTPFGAIEYLDFHYYQANIDLRHKASLTELAWYWNVLFGILMAGANSMIKLYYRAIITNQRMLDLERQSMEAQMQYLKYQINPHFLMNTLNNIYALIDFDRDLAKCSVMDLSRMMRHVLYDASESETTLDKEVEFIENYIELMRIRYVDDVMINFSAPDINTCRKVRIPPLLLIVLVENAFKHGISYNHRSFINIEVMEQGDNLVCIVENSRHYAQAATKHSGIGLSNIKKRLQLLYADNFSLTTDNTETDVYRIKLVIPKIR